VNRAKTGFGVPTGAWLSAVVGAVSASHEQTTTKGEVSRAWSHYLVGSNERRGPVA
jgi:hypothetical protein